MELTAEQVTSKAHGLATAADQAGDGSVTAYIHAASSALAHSHEAIRASRDQERARAEQAEQMISDAIEACPVSRKQDFLNAPLLAVVQEQTRWGMWWQNVAEAERLKREQAERERDAWIRASSTNELGRLRERIAALEAHVRELREQLLYELGTHGGPTGLIDRSLALVPDETTRGE